MDKKQEFKWKLRHGDQIAVASNGDLINAAKEIDELAKKVEAHSAIDVIENDLCGKCDRPNAEFRLRITLPFTVTDENHEIVDELKVEAVADNILRVQPACAHVDEGIYVDIIVSCNSGDYVSVAGYAGLLDALLEMANNCDSIAQQIQDECIEEGILPKE